MIRKLLVMSAVAANCYAVDGTQTDKNDVAGLTTRLNEQTLSDNQSPAVQTSPTTDPTDHMITIYNDGEREVTVYGEGM